MGTGSPRHASLILKGVQRDSPVGLHLQYQGCTFYPTWRILRVQSSFSDWIPSKSSPVRDALKGGAHISSPMPGPCVRMCFCMRGRSVGRRCIEWIPGAGVGRSQAVRGSVSSWRLTQMKSLSQFGTVCGGRRQNGPLVQGLQILSGQNTLRSVHIIGLKNQQPKPVWWSLSATHPNSPYSELWNWDI